MWSTRFFALGFEVVGSRARMRVAWLYHPQAGGRIRIDGPQV
jgi:hypothetical protein